MNTQANNNNGPDRPISGARLAANRANARKSTGPRTEEGKARSSMNALKHGFTADVKLLPGESQEDFDRLLAGFLDFHRPASVYEISLVDHLVTIEWQTRRIRTIEMRLLEMESSHPEITRGFTELSGTYRSAVAYDRLSQHDALRLANRQLARLHRERLGFTQLLNDCRQSSPPVVPQALVPAEPPAPRPEPVVPRPENQKAQNEPTAPPPEPACFIWKPLPAKRFFTAAASPPAAAA